MERFTEYIEGISKDYGCITRWTGVHVENSK